MIPTVAAAVIDPAVLDRLRSAFTFISRWLTVSALAHTHYVTRFRANPRCRFDHATWEVDSVGRDPAAMTLAEVFSLGRDLDGPLRLGVAQQRFARALHCLACGGRRPVRRRRSGTRRRWRSSWSWRTRFTRT